MLNSRIIWRSRSPSSRTWSAGTRQSSMIRLQYCSPELKRSGRPCSKPGAWAGTITDPIELVPAPNRAQTTWWVANGPSEL